MLVLCEQRGDVMFDFGVAENFDVNNISWAEGYIMFDVNTCYCK